MPIRRLIAKIKRSVIIKLGVETHEVINFVAKQSLPQFGNNPKNLNIHLPRRFINPEHIFLGDNITFGPGSFLCATTHYPTSGMQHPNKEQSIQRFDPKIIIGNRVTATADLQIAAVRQVVIEDDVMFASNVHINDSSHGYQNANDPYKYQELFKIAPILIRKGCWIGQNVVILSGVTIGELSIIGANSVVTGSIPARCIALGNPARVIKKWDESSQEWLSEK